MAEEQNKNNDARVSASGSGGSGNPNLGTSSETSGLGNTGSSSKGQGGQSGQQSGSQGSGQGTGSTDQLASQVGGILRGDTGAATSAAKGIVSQVKESGGKVASEALGTVKEKATTKIEDQKATLAQGLGSVAGTIRQVGETLRGAGEETPVASTAAQYGDSLASQVEQFSGYLERHNVSELMRDVERFARRNPAYFIGGAFVLGLLGARFLKSSNPNQALMAYEGGNSGTGSGEEVFHHHVPGEPVDAGKSVSGSGEGIQPV